MFIDSRLLTGSQTVEADICVVGAGPAGLAIAREFNGTAVRVAILEAGSFQFSEEVASLTDGEVVGDPFSPLRDMRHRQFGGMANVWNVQLHPGRVGVRYVPLDPIDFEQKDWVPHSGWPITFDDLVPYYRRAHAFCQLGEFDYSADPWETDNGRRTAFLSDDITTGIFKFGPSDIFFMQYRQEMSNSSNVNVYLHANVTGLLANENSTSIDRVQVGCLNGTRFTVKAKTFVLASGALENARLLLASNRQEQAGLGNRHDVVGRYFMDHPLVDFGMLFPYSTSAVAKMCLYDKKRVNGETVMGRYALSEALIRREQLLNISALIYPRDERFRSEAKRSLKHLLAVIKRGDVPDSTLSHIRNIVRRPHHILGDLYQYKIKKEVLKPNLAFGEWSAQSNVKKYVKFEVLTQTEQTPHPDNRVTLSTQRDRLGVPQVKLTNFWREQDIRSIKRAQQLFADAFEHSDVGKLVWDDAPRPKAMMSTHHNMGTTRMHSDPRQGVVDANCQVFGLSNLFIAGSSVFTTGGYANPTLTIVALSIRLAGHLKSSFT
ncbi:MAG TPA: GMC family oxidoreductase [Chryseolinea sp.]|nr:GMC family oxidoreductase [Chryseolinea sp.]